VRLQTDIQQSQTLELKKTPLNKKIGEIGSKKPISYYVTTSWKESKIKQN
jgi:hypothetical protein